MNEDSVTISSWLRKDYVLQWYHDTEEWLQEIDKRNSQFSFIKHRIVMYNDIPIGFCQYYDCYNAQEDWYSVPDPGITFSIDYLIGEPDYLRRGFGTQIVNALISEISRTTTATTVIAQPEKENTRSCRTLMSAGFVFDEGLDYYRYNIHN